jgi:hypothetical protein
MRDAFRTLYINKVVYDCVEFIEWECVNTIFPVVVL